MLGRRFCVLQRQRGASPAANQDAGLIRSVNRRLEHRARPSHGANLRELEGIGGFRAVVELAAVHAPNGAFHASDGWIVFAAPVFYDAGIC